MATNFAKEGKVINFTNTTGADIASGDWVVQGNISGVALHDIAIGDTQAVNTVDSFHAPKAAATVFAQGADVFLVAGEAADAGADKIGYAEVAAGAGELTVMVNQL